MAWHPKYIDGRISVLTGKKSTITIFSTIDSDHQDITLALRIQRSWWSRVGDYPGLFAQTEDGRRVLIRCHQETCESVEDMLKSFWGHDVLSREEGERIRRQAAEDARLNEMYNVDIPIYYSIYDKDFQYDEGLLRQIVQEKKQKILKVWKAANQGDAEAQNEVGRYYQDGIGVAKDDAEAVEWYHKSAEQGNAQAQNNLGWAYQNGLGVEKNEQEAILWYKKAAEQGNSYAINNLKALTENEKEGEDIKTGE